MYHVLILGCEESKIDYTGHDISNSVESLGNWRICSNICRSTSTCLYWTWQKTQKHCYLKLSKDGRKSNDKDVSGGRNCGLGILTRKN